MSFLPLEKARVFEAAMIRSAWRSLQVAAAVAIVVVPFGYAATGAGDGVAMGRFPGSPWASASISGSARGTGGRSAS